MHSHITINQRKKIVMLKNMQPTCLTVNSTTAQQCNRNNNNNNNDNNNNGIGSSDNKCLHPNRCCTRRNSSLNCKEQHWNFVTYSYIGTYISLHIFLTLVLNVLLFLIFILVVQNILSHTTYRIVKRQHITYLTQASVEFLRYNCT